MFSQNGLNCVSRWGPAGRSPEKDGDNKSLNQSFRNRAADPLVFALNEHQSSDALTTAIETLVIHTIYNLKRSDQLKRES